MTSEPQINKSHLVIICKCNQWLGGQRRLKHKAKIIRFSFFFFLTQTKIHTSKQGFSLLKSPFLPALAPNGLPLLLKPASDSSSGTSLESIYKSQGMKVTPRFLNSHTKNIIQVSTQLRGGGCGGCKAIWLFTKNNSAPLALSLWERRGVLPTALKMQRDLSARADPSTLCLKIHSQLL